MYRVIEFRSLQSQLAQPDIVDVDFAKFLAGRQILLATQALHRYVTKVPPTTPLSSSSSPAHPLRLMPLIFYRLHDINPASY